MSTEELTKSEATKNREFLCRYIEADANDKIKAYFLRNVFFDSGYVMASASAIGKSCGVSPKTANDSIKALRIGGFVKKYQIGVWIVNPKLLHHPNSKAYKEIMEEFVKTVDDIKEELA